MSLNLAAESSLALAALAGFACVLGFGPLRDLPEVAIGGLFVLAPLAVALGCVGRGRAARIGESKAVANAGIVLAGLILLVFCLVPANAHRGEPAFHAQHTSNLKQVAMALHNYANQHGRLPPAVVRDPSGRPLYSWRVLILPYMEEGRLYQRFRLDEPWDGPHNRALLAEAPHAYRAIGTGDPPEMTHVQAFVGPGAMFEGREGLPFGPDDIAATVPDGSDNTVLVVEARRPVPWSAPLDVPFGPGAPIPAFGGGYRRSRPLFHLRTPIQRFDVATVNGAVRSLPVEVDEGTLRALVTRNGREAIDGWAR